MRRVREGRANDRLEEPEGVQDDSGDASGSHSISESFQPTVEEEMMAVDQVGRLKICDQSDS